MKPSNTFTTYRIRLNGVPVMDSESLEGIIRAAKFFRKMDKNRSVAIRLVTWKKVSEVPLDRRGKVPVNQN